MAIEFLTSDQIADIVKLYLAYFNRAPETAGLDFHVNAVLADLNAGETFDQALNNRANQFYQAAIDAPQYSGYSVSMTADQFITKIYENVLLRPGAGGAAPTQAEIGYWEDRLSGAIQPQISRGELVTSFLDAVPDLIAHGTPAEVALATQVQTVLDARLEVALEFAKPEHSGNLSGEAAFNAGSAVLQGVVDEASAQAAIAELNSNAGQVFNLTDNADQIPGLIGSKGTTDNSGDDTIVAGTSNSAAGNTLGSADNIDGGAGRDTLKIISAANAALTLVPMTHNVEVFDIQGLTNGLTVNMINANAVEEVWSDHSTANVSVTNIQNNLTLGIKDTANDLIATFVAGALGPVVNTAFDGAGVVGGAQADLYINGATADVNAITTLNIDSSNHASNVLIDIDNGGATDARPATINITGDADLTVRDGDGLFNLVTAVNVTSTGGLNMDLSNDNQNIVFHGGTGSTWIDVSGTGNNVVTTQGGNDTVDASGSGNVDVSTGAGDDLVILGSNATVADKVDGGLGNDTLRLDVFNASALSVNTDFAASISGFENIDFTGDVTQGNTATIDMNTFDNISNITVHGTEQGTAEVQNITVNTGDLSNGGVYSIGGVEVVFTPGNAASIAAQFDAAEAAIKAGNPNISNITHSGNTIEITYLTTAGNVDPIQITNLENTGVGFNGANSTPGSQSVAENQVISFVSNATTNGGFTVNLGGGGSVPAPTASISVTGIIGGETTAELATATKAAIDHYISITSAYSGVTTSINANTYSVEIHFPASFGDVNAPTVTSNTTGAGVAYDSNYNGATPNSTVNTTNDGGRHGAVGAEEVQTLVINHAADHDGVIFLNSGKSGAAQIEIPITTGSIDSVGGQIVAYWATHMSDFAAQGITGVNYDTAFDRITINYDRSLNDPAPTTFETTSAVAFSGVGELNGTNPGMLVINNMHSGDTVTMVDDDNDGITHLNLATQSSADSLNIVINTTPTAPDASGLLQASGVETLNFTQQRTTFTGINVDGSDATTVTVKSSTGGLHFDNEWAKVTTFDASGVTATGNDGSVTFTTNATTAASITGGAGNDILTGGSAGDTIIGGAGDDHIIGRGGADNLTGGTGDNVFVLQAATDSNGSNSDTINGFVSHGATAHGDKIDVSAFAAAGGHYTGEVSGMLALQTELLHNGHAQAIFETQSSTLYIDADGNGIIDNNDVTIHMVGGATHFVDADFVF